MGWRQDIIVSKGAAYCTWVGAGRKRLAVIHQVPTQFKTVEIANVANDKYMIILTQLSMLQQLILLQRYGN